MDFTEEHSKQIAETHDTVIKINTILLGANGTLGLASKVEESCKKQNELEKKFWYLVGTLVGLGIISGSIVGILKMV